MTLRCRVFLGAILLALCSGLVFADPVPLKTLDDVRHFSEGVFGSVAHVHFDGAWNQMRVHSIMPKAAFEKARDRVSDEINARADSTGSVEGEFKIVGEKTPTTQLYSIEALVPHERYTYRWVLHFAKARQGWFLNNFAIDGIQGLKFPK